MRDTEAETLIRRSGMTWTILRPSIIMGKGSGAAKAQDKKIMSLLSMLPEEMLPTGNRVQTSRTVYDAQNSIQGLTPHNLKCPPADDRLIGMYLDRLAL